MRVLDLGHAGDIGNQVGLLIELGAGRERYRESRHGARHGRDLLLHGITPPFLDRGGYSRPPKISILDPRLLSVYTQSPNRRLSVVR
jgi:hypothetical protein